MKILFRLLLPVLCFIFLNERVLAQDTVFIKVHFLYGSKPAAKFRAHEKIWFGGMLGGHVGIETPGRAVMNFVTNGRFHLISKANNRHSRFAVHSPHDFWEIFGKDADSVKQATVIIPVTQKQKAKLDSIYSAYTHNTPYDYAFIGMRCGSAAYDILAQIGIMEKYKRSKTILKIFYPRKLRKRLIKKAIENNWQIIRNEGCKTRKWEKDKGK